MAVAASTRFTGEGRSWRKLRPLLHLLPMAGHHLLHQRTEVGVPNRNNLKREKIQQCHSKIVSIKFYIIINYSIIPKSVPIFQHVTLNWWEWAWGQGYMYIQLGGYIKLVLLLPCCAEKQLCQPFLPLGTPCPGESSLQRFGSHLDYRQH